MDVAIRIGAIGLASIVLVFMALRVYARREVQFIDAPARPSLLTSRLHFHAGAATYCLLLLTFYLIVAYHWGPIGKVLGPHLSKIGDPGFLGDIVNSNPPDGLIPWVAAVAVVLVFAWDNKYNPFTIVLEAIFDMLRIPGKAVGVFQALQETQFGLPDDALAKAISTHPEIYELRPAYFGKNRRTIEYRWAHVSYLRHFLLQVRPSFGRYFNDRSLQWKEIGDEYAALAPRIRAWVQDPKDYLEAAAILEDIRKLKDRHYRFVACLAVTNYRNDRDVWDWISNFSRAEVKPKPVNLARYLVFLIPTIFITVPAGTVLFTYLYQLVAGEPISPDVDSMRFWAFACIALYSLPIAIVFAIRWLLRERMPFESKRYWGFYIVSFLIGYGLCALLLPVMWAVDAGQVLSPSTWIDSFARLKVWAVLPGFIAAFVAFRLDWPASCRDPAKRAMTDRLVAAAACGGAGVVISTLAVLHPSYSASKAIIIVATVLLTTFSIGFLSRFETT